MRCLPPQIAATQMTMNGARYQALFCSALLQQFGIRGCVDRMAQEFGEHPDTAAKRMLWARQLIAQGPASADPVGSGAARALVGASARQQPAA